MKVVRILLYDAEEVPPIAKLVKEGGKEVYCLIHGNSRIYLDRDENITGELYQIKETDTFRLSRLEDGYHLTYDPKSAKDKQFLLLLEARLMPKFIQECNYYYKYYYDTDFEDTDEAITYSIEGNARILCGDKTNYPVIFVYGECKISFECGGENFIVEWDKSLWRIEPVSKERLEG